MLGEIFNTVRSNPSLLFKLGGSDSVRRAREARSFAAADISFSIVVPSENLSRTVAKSWGIRLIDLSGGPAAESNYLNKSTLTGQIRKVSQAAQ
jgi:hypothetical protein